MRYVLEEDVFLRSWRNAPRCLCVLEGRPYPPQRLTEDQCAFLERCDGRHEIPQDDPLVRHFLVRRIIRPAEVGESAADWQRRTCDCDMHIGVLWEITSRCNMNCLHCFNAEDDSPGSNEFTMQEACHFLDGCEAAGIRGFRLTGGEPLVHPDFLRIVEEIYARHMEVWQVETNGLLLDDGMLLALKRYNPELNLRISFDGLGYHDRMRRLPGCEERTLQSIERACSMGFPVLANVNVNWDNRDAIYPTVIRLADLGVRAVRLIRTSEAPRVEMNAGDLVMSAREYLDLCLEVTELYRDSGRKANLVMWAFGIVRPGGKNFDCSAVKGPCSSFDATDSLCVFSARAFVQVSSDGTMHPCHGTKGWSVERGLSLGNVKDGPFVERLVARDAQFETLGHVLERNEECSSCPYVLNCRGGCPVIAILANGTYLAPDPTKCLALKGGYYDRLCEILEGWQDLRPLERDVNQPEMLQRILSESRSGDCGKGSVDGE